MMADFDLMELAPEQQEDLAYLHQQLFSTATEVVSAGAGEPAMVVTDTAAATVTMLHDVTGFTGNYGNGNTATEPKEDDKPAVSHGDGEALVGRSIVKKFKRTKYAGKVIGFDSECKWYKVKYEDDDEEELEFKELESLLVEADEAEAVKAANAKKRPVPETDSESKSPAKRGRGRPPGEKKTAAQANAGKKTKALKSPKSPKSPKKVSPKKSEEKEVSESLSTEKKNASTPGSGEKRGRGRPRKDAAAVKTPAKTKADGKGSGDSSSESKPSTRKSTSAQDKGESRSGRSPRGKSAVSPSARGPLSQKEGHQLIGAKIKKKFDGVMYDGEVTGFDPRMGYYKALYSDGDKEEYTLKELKALLVEDQATPKTRGRSKSRDATPAKAAAASPQKKQKVSTPKKDAAKTQSPARDAAHPRKRGRPAKAKR